MDIRIKEKLKNQQGSSLAFVLIIGMVIMIMVASLLVVANGDFTFTQETLESRQAYIDAKSVIEVGKIEINKRMTELNNKNEELENLYDDYKIEKEKSQPIASAITPLEQKISAAENERDILVAALANSFAIYGNPDDVTGTITTVEPDAVNAAEIVQLGELSYDADNERFTIETQGLRRKLDYQADFSYTPTTSTPVTPGTSAVPGTPDMPATGWHDTWIMEKNGKYPVSCEIKGDGNQHKGYDSPTLTVESAFNLAVGQNNGNGDGKPDGNGDTDKFKWTDDQNLNLTARNIAVVVPLPDRGVAGAQFNITALGTTAMPATKKTAATAQVPGQIWFTKGYHQVNGDVNTLSAYNIIIKGDLIIDDNSYLVINNCANLWVIGNISIKTNKTDAISATNIIVEGTIDPTSNVNWKCTNFWINGVKQPNNSSSGTSGGGSVIVTPGSTGFIKDLYY